MNSAVKTIYIGEQPVGDGHPAYVLAEAGCNHNQSVELAFELVDMAVRARADGVKFQTYVADRIYSKKTPMMKHFADNIGADKDATMYDLIKMTELPRDMHQPVVDYCAEKKIPFISTPFDPSDVDFLETFDPPAYKIASFEMTHYPLIRRTAATGKPIILSTGMSTLGDIERVLAATRSEGNNDVILLHCVTNYPAKPEDYNLRAIATLRNAFGLPVGLSDHTPGVEVPKLAFALGINFIEKHCTTDQSLPGPDHHFSLTPDQLRDLVDARDFVEEAMGSPFKTCTDAEQEMKRIGRRSMVADCDIPRGTKITADMIAVKRPGTGLHPMLREDLIGCEAIRDIEEDDPLTWDMFLTGLDS